jgi:hypothetical protein
MPGDLEDTIVFAVAMMASATQTMAGKALVDFLRTPEAAAAVRAIAADPGRWARLLRARRVVDI